MVGAAGVTYLFGWKGLSFEGRQNFYQGQVIPPTRGRFVRAEHIPIFPVVVETP